MDTDERRKLITQNDALEALKESAGWQLLRQTMIEELELAVASLGQPNLTPDDVTYRRGAIWAGRNLVDMPDAMIDRNNSRLPFMDAVPEARTTKDE